MDVSKLTFTKDTKDKMKKPISVREKGKILFARLQELEEDGTLSKAKSRADVARLVGYPRERAKAGYAWVSNLIRRGHITETIRGYSPSGVADCEYHLTNSRPDYGYEEQRRHKVRKEAVAKVAEEAIRQGLVEQEIARPLKAKLEITRGDLVIKLELNEGEQAIELIKQLLNN